MKNSILKMTLLFAATMQIVTSCSSDNGNSNSNPNPTTEDTWKLNNYNYSRNNSTQTSTSYINGNPFTILNIDSNTNDNNDSFKTCNLVIAFNTSTTGTYLVKSENSVISNTTQKLLDIRCIVSDGLGNGASYSSIDSNLSATVTQVNGKFVVTITEPVTLNLTMNDGISQAPQTFTFRCNNVR
jgi:hypothetical protein